MRIGLFCNDYWPTIGGVQTGARFLACALRDRGHTVVVLTRQPGGCAAAEELDGIQVRRFDWNLAPAASFPARFLRARAAVRAVAQEFALDTMYAHFVSIHAVYARDAAKQRDAAFLVSFRGNDAMRIAPRNRITRWAYGTLTRDAGAVLFCSQWLLEETLNASWFRGRTGRIGTLEDAADVSGRAVPRDLPRKPFIVSGGRLVTKKGFDILIRAWQMMGSVVGVPLYLAGDGPEFGALQALISELGLGAQVHLIGEVPHPELLGWLSESSLCIVPSREEPYGIFVVEAQALGVPVIGCAVGNIPFLIEDGRTGYLSAPSPEGLASVILRAWCDSARPGIAKNAREAPGARRTYATMAEELEEWADVARTA